MKLNEELVIKLLDGSSHYIYMTVGSNIEIYGGKNDRFVYYNIMDRNLHQIEDGKIKFISSKYENTNLKNFVPNVIRHIYGRPISYIVTNLKSSDVIIGERRDTNDEKIIEARNIILDMISENRHIIKSMDVLNGVISYDYILPVLDNTYRLLTSYNNHMIWTAIKANSRRLTIDEVVTLLLIYK